MKFVQRYDIFYLDISGFPSLLLAHVFLVARWKSPGRKQ